MISLQNVNFGYHRKQELFRNLNLELAGGKIYGLLGKNATGKSTLFKLIVGALFAKEGRVEVDSRNAQDRDPDILQDIFYLQEEYQVPSISIRSYVNIYSAFYPFFNLDKFEDILASFEVDWYASFSNLSFGQTKKVMIAFGLATSCKYILLDEPTNGLDIPSKSQLRKLITTEVGEEQTLIISTHQVRDISSVIEGVIIIDNGRVLLSSDLYDISNKLYFTRGVKEELEGDVCYSEMVTGGYIHIMKNDHDMDSDVELETLFNAITKHPEIVSKYL